jgi:hypothetical protein
MSAAQVSNWRGLFSPTAEVAPPLLSRFVVLAAHHALSVQLFAGVRVSKTDDLPQDIHLLKWEGTYAIAWACAWPSLLAPRPFGESRWDPRGSGGPYNCYLSLKWPCVNVLLLVFECLAEW